MRRLAPGLAVGWRPVLALPVDAVRGRFLRHAFPPDIAVVGQRDVGVDDVGLERRHRVVIGFLRCSWRDAKETCLGVDGVELAVLARLDPGDVVADRGNFPAVEGSGRNQHGKVGLAAGRWEGSGDVGFFTGGRFDAENQHVLGQPTLVARHGGGDTQRQTFLAEQGIAAITGAVGPDFARLGKMHDVFGGRVARPFDILLTFSQRRPDRVQARHEEPGSTEYIEHGFAHARHGPHVDDDIGTIGNLDADLGDGRTQWTHAEGDHIQSPSLHAAREQALESFLHLGRVFPVVGGASVFLFGGANVGTILDTRDVGGIGAGEVGIGPLLLIELDEGPGSDHLGT